MRAFSLPAITDGEELFDEYPKSLVNSSLSLLQWAILSRRDGARECIKYLTEDWKFRTEFLLANQNDFADAVRLSVSLHNHMALAFLAWARMQVSFEKPFSSQDTDKSQIDGTYTRWLTGTTWRGVEFWHHDVSRMIHTMEC